MKRGTDHNWELRQHDGDVAIYAHCKCGYWYNCSTWTNKKDGIWRSYINIHYHYCPHCGARKKHYIGDDKFLNRII